MVAGYVFRNKLVRAHAPVVARKVSNFQKAKEAVRTILQGETRSFAPVPLPDPTVRRYDVFSWDGELLGWRIDAADVKRFIPHMDEERFNLTFERDRQVVSTSCTVLLNESEA